MKLILLIVFSTIQFCCIGQQVVQTHFTDLDEALKQPENVQSLKLTDHLIFDKYLPDSFLKFTKLNNLYLGWSKELDYAQVFKLLSQLPLLDTFELQSCNIVEIPSEIGLMTRLKSLTILSSNLKIISAQIGQLKNLEHVNFSMNDIANLPIELGNLSNLKTLSLVDNDIIELPNSLCRLRNLESIYVWHNKLNSLPACISEISSLKQLSISGNPIENLPMHLNKLNLESISMNGVYQKEFPYEIFDIKTLNAISIYGGQIDSFPDRISELQNLEYLVLVDVNMKDWSDTYTKLGKLNRLKKMTLKNFRESTIPVEISTLKSVEDLTIIGYTNSFATISHLSIMPNLKRLEYEYYADSILPPSIGNMKQLQYLKIKTVKLNMLPPEIVGMVSLEELNISSGGWNTSFVVTKEIGELKKLKKLDLSSCKIKELPNEIGELVSLEELNLGGNKLSMLPASIGQLLNLKKLYVGSNRLVSIPNELMNLDSLVVLYLSDNRLDILNPGICQLLNLKYLSLDGNFEIKSLPTNIGQLSKLEYLNIEETQVTELPSSLKELQYLRQIKICNTLIKNKHAIERDYKNKIVWGYGCYNLEKLVIDFDKKYGNTFTWLETFEDTIQLNYEFMYNEPNSIDEEYILLVEIKIATCNTGKNVIINLPDSSVTILASHTSVWDWGSTYENIDGQLTFIHVKKNRIRVNVKLNRKTSYMEAFPLIDNKELVFSTHKKRMNSHSFRDVYK